MSGWLGGRPARYAPEQVAAALAGARRQRLPGGAGPGDGQVLGPSLPGALPLPAAHPGPTAGRGDGPGGPAGQAGGTPSAPPAPRRGRAQGVAWTPLSLFPVRSGSLAGGPAVGVRLGPDGGGRAYRHLQALPGAGAGGRGGPAPVDGAELARVRGGPPGLRGSGSRWPREGPDERRRPGGITGRTGAQPGPGGGANRATPPRRSPRRSGRPAGSSPTPPGGWPAGPTRSWTTSGATRSAPRPGRRPGRR